MKQLVLDTNTLISAVGWRDSKQRKILEACLFKRYLLIETADLLKAFFEVISRPKSSFVPEEQKSEFVTRLISHCEIVEPKKEAQHRQTRSCRQQSLGVRDERKSRLHHYRGPPSFEP
ncbi:MAG: hypothetical protein A2Y81_04790 [Nitrospirae bacterium RBG_13_43_8]|nr:MAG: hypothetical protein A2Y81_04790 [Nitrospirae bacterium RBG_13_43_8]